MLFPIALLRVIPTVTNYFVIVSDISSGKYIWGIYFLTFYSGILFDILTFYSIVAFYLTSILTSYLASFLAFYLAFYLTFYSGILSVWHIHSGILSGIYSDISILTYLFWCWDLALVVEVRSGSAHWDLELAVEVQQCPLSCDVEFAVEVWKEGREEGRKEGKEGSKEARKQGRGGSNSW